MSFLIGLLIGMSIVVGQPVESVAVPVEPIPLIVLIPAAVLAVSMAAASAYVVTDPFRVSMAQAIAMEGAARGAAERYLEDAMRKARRLEEQGTAMRNQRLAAYLYTKEQ